MLHSLPARMISGKKNPQVVLHRFLDKEAKIHWKFKSTYRLKEKVYTNSWLLWKWDGLHSRRDNSDQITEQNISRICYFCHVWTKNKLKKKKKCKEMWPAAQERWATNRWQVKITSSSSCLRSWIYPEYLQTCSPLPWATSKGLPLQCPVGIFSL